MVHNSTAQGISPKSPEQESAQQAEILQTLIDISHIITTSHNLDETLGQTVMVIARRMEVDVCSIYLYDENLQVLVLKATHGLNPEAVGHVSMPVREGIIGMVMEECTPLNLLDVSKHPRYKFFPSINEERLSSLCAVPLIEYRKPLGVLAIQNQEHRRFTPDEENLLITIASQISGLISKALLVARMQREAEKPAPRRNPREPARLEGIPIAPGVAQERVVVLNRGRLDEPPYTSGKTVEEEKRLLANAINQSVNEILALIQDVTSRLGERDAAIFHSHLLFLEDRGFNHKINKLIDEGGSASWAVSQVVREYLETFASIADPYLKERGADLEDVGYRLLQHLGLYGRHDEILDHSGILVAELLTPSDTARLNPEKIKGIVTTVGGFVSHAAILARSLRIPAVSGIENLLDLVEEGEELLVDGESGLVFVNPSQNVRDEYARYSETRSEYLSHLDDLRDVACTTRDGFRINLFANVGLSQDLEDVKRYGAEGIGLYRTEVQFLMSEYRPTQGEMDEMYAKVVQEAGGRPVVFRTLDLGGDKFPPYLHFPKEDNPFLGNRSIRYQLTRVHLLKDQLRAIFKVSRMGDVKVLIPMISQLDELYQVKGIIAETRRELELELGETLPDLPLGMMFEVPSAVLMADMYAREIDFLSIGSNDLTQYTLAVDRNNPQVSHLYDPLDPAVLRLIQGLIQTARRFNKPLELCGEMASDTEGCLLLVGLGLRQLSMNAPLIPLVKDRLSKVTLADTQKLASIALSSTTASSVRRNIRMFLSQFK
ncbi:MAG: phosphoenolpyruvate--protein phosphotransferase [Deltaproteobacteria bacterium]|nr:phosphoenolpyruvate--protein phosphotransferase [Deltaproteobacteria bacterium]